jgi:hypothetical protein
MRLMETGDDQRPGRRKRRTGGNAPAGISPHPRTDVRTADPAATIPPTVYRPQGGVVTTTAPIECSYPDCQQTARGRVAAPVLLDANLGDKHGFVVIRPVGTHLTKGAPYCVDHIHHAVDLTLLAAEAT